MEQNEIDRLGRMIALGGTPTCSEVELIDSVAFAHFNRQVYALATAVSEALCFSERLPVETVRLLRDALRLAQTPPT